MAQEQRKNNMSSGRNLTAVPPTDGGTVSRPTATATAVYQVVPQFVGKNNTPASEPFLIPPNCLYPNPGYVIDALNIGSVYGKKITTGACGISTDSNNVDFSLSWSGLDAHSLPTAVITISPNNVWSGDPTLRAQLRKSFDAFRLKLEDLEINQQCLRPGGAYTISQTLAESIPLSLSETLYYRYGFDAANGYIDLIPGMRLRIESAANQVMSSLAPISSLNGFVPSSVAYYGISRLSDSSGNQRLAFDAFLGSNRPPAITSLTGVAGGIIDLQKAATARRYYRLIYPAQLAPPDRPDNAGLYDNVTLIGADLLSDLNVATNPATRSSICGTSSDGNAPVLCNYFRGRSIAIPELRVFLATPQAVEPMFVPVGATVRNLLDYFGNNSLPLVTNEPGFPGFNYRRPFSIPVGQFPQVTFKLIDPIKLPQGAYFAGKTVYDLPVTKGDSLNFQFQ
jgi:hypothetical protein